MSKTKFDEPLSVARTSFLEEKQMSVNNLFDGYDDMKVVTFSYDLDFIEKIAEKFKTMTVLLGCERIVGEDVVSLEFANQQCTVNEIQKHESLMNRAFDGSIVFRVAHRITSHQKFYILTAEDGHTRIIFGSANFSRKGFSGMKEQGEIISVIDDEPNAVEYFMNLFDALDENCMDTVELDSLKVKVTDDPNAEILPISGTIKAGGVGVIVNVTDDTSQEEVIYTTDVSNMKRKYTESMQEMQVKIDRRSKRQLLEPAYIRDLTKTVKTHLLREKEKKKVCPKIHVDYDFNTVDFNGKEYDLKNIDMNAVKKDLQNLCRYFDGFNGLRNNILESQKLYYKLMLFMFTSPFIAKLRATANTEGFNEMLFPYFAVVGGRPSAGKTEFVKTIQYMMTGRHIALQDKSLWSVTNMQKHLQNVEGIPTCIDDMDRRKFSNEDATNNIVKCDSWIYEMGLVNHGTYVITSNNITTIPKMLTKRMFFINIPSAFDTADAILQTKQLADLRKSMTTSLYSAFLDKMLPKVHELINRMENATAKDNYIPDVFRCASDVMKSLMKDTGLDQPDWMYDVTYQEYCGEENDAVKDMKEHVKTDWEYNRSVFHVNRKRGRKPELEYTVGEHSYEAQRIYEQLPERLNARQSGTKVIMNLDEAEAYFNIPFSRNRFPLWAFR